MASSSPVRYPLLSSGGHVPATPLRGLRSSTSIPQTPRSHLSVPKSRGELFRTRSGSEGHFGTEGMSELGASDQEGQFSVVWGTNVSVREAQSQFRSFIFEFLDSETGSPKYTELLEEILAEEEYNLNLDCRNLADFNQQLYHQLICYPQEIIPVFDLVIHEIVQERYSEFAMQRRVQVRTFNLLNISDMRGLDPSNIDQMVAIQGMVIRAGDLIPDLKIGFFRCGTCGHELEVAIDRGKIQHPQKCNRCKNPKTYELIHNRCVYANKQLIRIQEAPENIPDGFTPQTVDAFAFDDLVGVARPGDRVEITGIFRAVPVRTSRKKTTVRAVYKSYFDVIHFKRVDKRRCDGTSGGESIEGILEDNVLESDTLRVVTEERERRLIEIGRDGNIYQKLVDSVAPSIFGMEDVKKGILCQLFSGTTKNFPSSLRGRFRGDINVLLCGDPGVSKSQILRYVHLLSPRGIYTSGKGSSAVGLTAYVTKDPETKQLVLESGALVLSDRGICCIDEFDKMSDSTRSILHEVMEQQTVSIAKAGIIATLNARTAILAAANPVHSRWDPKLSVVENIRLGPTLLSRFDLIYLLLDKPSEMMDRKLAKHLISMYYSEDERQREPESNERGSPDRLDLETLSAYISYARKNIHPQISNEAAKDLVSGYTSLRRRGQNKKVVTATPRQLESLIRLSEALAKMRLSQTVGREDVAEAIRLMDVSLGQSATDPETGVIDIDMFVVGYSSSWKRSVEKHVERLKEIIIELPTATIRLLELFKKYNEKNPEESVAHVSEFRKIVDILASAGAVRISQQQSSNPEIRRLSER